MKYSFGRAELMKLGLYFRTSEEADLFLRIITEEYEIRIGTEMSKYLPPAPVFADCCDGEDDDIRKVEEWVRDHPEETDKILTECKEKLFEEIGRYKKDILGREPVFPEKVRQMKIEELDLSPGTLFSLHKAKLTNVGAVLDHGDLSDVVRLGDRSLNEVMCALGQLGTADSA